MDFNQFFRLLKANILLLIGVPLVLLISVYFFSQGQPKSYTSETTVYTGIGSGYSIENQTRGNVDFYGTNMQFDNLINIIKSRNTKEQTAIRLLAQHLSLEQPNPLYISAGNYYNLQSIVPKEVKDLVVKYGKTGAERDKLKQIKQRNQEIAKLQHELNRMKKSMLDPTIDDDVFSIDTISQEIETIKPKHVSLDGIHIVTYGESLSSIASQHNLTIGQLVRLNDLKDGDLKVGDRLYVKRQTTQGSTTSRSAEVKNKYHIVRPKETLFSIARQYNASLNNLRSWNNLGTDALTIGATIIVGKEGMSNSNDIITDKISDFSEYVESDYRHYNPDQIVTERREYNNIVPDGINESDYFRTVENLTAYYQSSDSNFIYALLQYGHPHYSVGAISQAQINRVQNSDLVNISYSSDDPGICQHTLKILTRVFITNFKAIGAQDVDKAVRYFEEEVRKAAQRLKNAEDKHLKFKQENNLINYAEQTEAIAVQKEELDKTYQDKQVEMRSAAAALRKLESKLIKKDSIFLKSDMITNKRRELSQISEKLVINEIAQDFDEITSDGVKELHVKKQQLEDEIKLYLDQLFMYQQSIEGVPVTDLLNSWLQNIIIYESAKASLSVLQNRKNDYKRIYAIFAPLGATLTRIEREIGVAEQEYLELLRSLNQARMRQQNLEMSSSIKIVDPPYYPLTVSSSNTKFLMLAAAFLGFLLVVFVILVLEYFDSSNKTPEKLQKATTLSMAGIFPNLDIKDENIDMPYVTSRVTELIIQNLSLQLRHTSVNKPEKPYFILIMSTQPDTGKTVVGHYLKEKLESYGSEVLYMNYKTSTDQQLSESEYIYDINNKFFEIEHVRQLLDTSALRSDNKEYDYILLEIPSIIHNSYPLDLMKTIDGSLLVAKASNSWKKADAMALDNFQKVTNEEPMFIMNKADRYAIDELLHGIPTTGNSTWTRFKRKATAPFRMRIKFKDEEEDKN